MPSPLCLSPSIVHLARQSAAAWQASRAYVGEATVETANTVYRFRDGAFTSAAKKLKLAGSVEAPKEMQGLVLVGFLADEGGLRSISTRFRPGAHAVLWNPGSLDASAFVVTSEVVAFALERSAPEAADTTEEPPRSGIIPKFSRRPKPVVAQSSPESMTRIFAAAK